MTDVPIREDLMFERSSKTRQIFFVDQVIKRHHCNALCIGLCAHRIFNSRCLLLPQAVELVDPAPVGAIVEIAEIIHLQISPAGATLPSVSLLAGLPKLSTGRRG